MDWLRLFFSFQGRINRAKYWLLTLMSLAVTLAVSFLLFTISGRPPLAVLLVLVIPFVVSVFAIAVKRLHDRDKSGWWMLLFYFLPRVLDSIGERTENQLVFVVMFVLSFGISIWAIIELGVLRGSIGPNRYGPDPISAPGQA
jgi:uncharacterized membrane protein YhaH (DUF805 family)